MEVNKVLGAIGALMEAIIAELEETEEEKVERLKNERARRESSKTGGKTQHDNESTNDNGGITQEGNRGLERGNIDATGRHGQYSKDSDVDQMVGSWSSIFYDSRTDGYNGVFEEDSIVPVDVVEFIKSNEGYSPKLYKDTTGNLTIGYGRNIQDVGISKDEAELMLINDIKRSIGDLKKIFKDFDDLPHNAKKALIDMMFNLGYPRFKKFKKMIAAVKERDWMRAAAEAKDSLWCRQVKSRCQKVAKLFSEIA